MHGYQRIFVCCSLIFFLIAYHPCTALTCNMMDTQPDIARAACVGSCLVQNCATGYCQKRSGQPVCVCSRCANGRGDFTIF
ncbi:unnamed protein product [Adineta steineri]|uniref:Uncharacterized protein n=1 Tax=Adineta steineri TaxID=433720 RepID=A0A819XAI2_9BILA|nr:unnamed protein product [Adineta steineri]